MRKPHEARNLLYLQNAVRQIAVHAEGVFCFLLDQARRADKGAPETPGSHCRTGADTRKAESDGEVPEVGAKNTGGV
jgi:hypothetical protein